MSNRSESGFTLIEMIIAIVIIGIGLAGVLAAFNTTVKSSADPLIHKQMLAAAEELMEEVLLKPFVPPVGVVPVNAATSCDLAAASRSAFDDVSDYHNYQTTGICDIDGAAVAGLGTYSIRVTIDAATTLDTLSGGAVKKVTVVVTHSGETVSLVGWRSDYAS
jgi:MSHA pilin protein MshD